MVEGFLWVKKTAKSISLSSSNHPQNLSHLSVRATEEKGSASSQSGSEV